MILFPVSGSREPHALDSCNLARPVVRSLTLLQDAPAGVVEATIALLPYKARCALAARGIVDAVHADASRAAAVRVTEHGRRLIHRA